MDDFPYTSNGKIDKRALRQMAFDKMARMQAEKEQALMAIKPAFYSPSPYDGKLLADILSSLPQPLPVYQMDIKADAGALITVHEKANSQSSSSSNLVTSTLEVHREVQLSISI